MIWGLAMLPICMFPPHPHIWLDVLDAWLGGMCAAASFAAMFIEKREGRT